MDEDFGESDDRHEPTDVRVIDFDVDLASFPRFAAPFNQQSRPGLQQNTTTNTTGQQSTNSAASSTSRRPDKRFVDSVKRPGYHRKDRLFFSGVPPPVPPEGKQCLLDRLLLVSNLHWIMNEAEVWDGGCAYGILRGLHIFDSPSRKKSDGIALLEFTEESAIQNAIKDQGRAWAVKQSDRPAHLHRATVEVCSAIENLPIPPGISNPHWTRASIINQALIDAVAKVVNKPSAPASVSTQQVYTTGNTTTTIPAAIAVLIEQMQEIA